jgi:hypothetical protein
MKLPHKPLNYLFLPIQVLIILTTICWTNPIEALDATGSYIRVATSGNDIASCGSDTSPCKTIQYAINKSQSGDIIKVASGTYTYNSSSDPCSFLITRAVACFQEKHITILGGYTTGDWVTANHTQNLTVIDGQNTWRGIAIFGNNGTASLQMEGFTIQNGLAQGIPSENDYVSYAFGGGIFAQGGTVAVKDIKFMNNRAIGASTGQSYGGGGSGGGVAVIYSGTANSTLENIIFENNQALGGSGAERGGVALGGGLYTNNAKLFGKNLTFTNNKAQAGNSQGSGAVGYLRADALGGGAQFQANSEIQISNFTATGNMAKGGNAGSSSGAIGGGAFGGAFHAEMASVNLTDSIIKDNTAIGGQATIGGCSFGGGFLTDSSNATLERTRVIANAAISGGSTIGGDTGGLGGGGGYVTYWDSSLVAQPTVKIVNCIFAKNRLQVGTPGRYTGGGGGGLTIQSVPADIIHSTFAENYFVGNILEGQAILVLGLYGTNGTPASVNMYYTIISDHINASSNSCALEVVQNSSANLYRGMFANNTNNTNSNGKPVPPGSFTGLSSMFSASSIKYVSPGSPNFDYHLQATSPAKDQATGVYLGLVAALDIDGQQRPYGSAPDIGADEYMPPALAPTPNTLMILTDENTDIQRSVLINVTYGPVVGWTASTNAYWLFLGTAGTLKSIGGNSGEYLIVRFSPALVDLGDYSDIISISSNNADGSIIDARLLKVVQIYSTHLPVILR